MRSPFDLAAITAQVNGGDQDFRIGGGQAALSASCWTALPANTNRAGSTLWAAVNAPSLDAITEFAVETNGFKAEFGRAGGGLVTFVSKSGTNQYHGTAFDFIRNNAFDARGFFNFTTPVYRQHDFGATFGGPVRIPKLYNGKNKTFFFVSYEGFRNRVGGATTAIALPPAEFYQGDFRNAVSRTQNPDGSLSAVHGLRPGHHALRPGHQQLRPRSVPEQHDSAGPFRSHRQEDSGHRAAHARSRCARTWFRGRRSTGWRITTRSGTSINPNNKFSVKFDHTLNDANRVSAYIGYSKRESVPGPTGANGIPGILNPFQQLSDTSPVYRGSWDSTISPRLHNRFYFGINRFHDSNFPLSEGGNWKDKICIPNVPDCNRNLPIITMGDFPAWGGNGFNGSENPIYSFNDDLTWTRGKHIFKAGYLYELAPYVGLGQQAGAGNCNFGTANTALPGQSNRNVGGGIRIRLFPSGDERRRHYQHAAPRRHALAVSRHVLPGRLAHRSAS